MFPCCSTLMRQKSHAVVFNSDQKLRYHVATVYNLVRGFIDLSTLIGWKVGISFFSFFQEAGGAMSAMLELCVSINWKWNMVIYF